MLNLNGKVIKKQLLREDVVELSLELPEPVQFIPGQHVQFFINGEPRAYSMVSTPGNAKVWSFCIELIPNGLGSEYVKHLQIGDTVQFRGPVGSFVVNDTDSDICFVATGVGVAPFKGMIEDLFQKGFRKKCSLIVGNRTEEHVLYKDYFANLASEKENFTFIPVLSRTTQLDYPYQGRVTTFLDLNFEQYSNYIFFVCGGMEMVADTRKLLLSKGKHLKDIHQEIFI